MQNVLFSRTCHFPVLGGGSGVVGTGVVVVLGTGVVGLGVDVVVGLGVDDLVDSDVGVVIGLDVAIVVGIVGAACFVVGTVVVDAIVKLLSVFDSGRTDGTCASLSVGATGLALSNGN